MAIDFHCARSPVDRTLASGAESVGSTPAERTIFVSLTLLSFRRRLFFLESYCIHVETAVPLWTNTENHCIMERNLWKTKSG